MIDEPPVRKPFLTISEVAALLRMHPRTLAEWLRAHPAELPLFAKPGRDYIISAGDVERIYEAMRDAPRDRPAKVSIKAGPSKLAQQRRLRKLTDPPKRKGR
jgi:Helix-turn-helix domain